MEGELETKQLLEKGIEEAARFASLDQLCSSPQCDFASTEEGDLLTTNEQRRKSRLCVATAKGVRGHA